MSQETNESENSEYQVDVWHKTERTVEVEAESEEEAEREAKAAVTKHAAGTAATPTEDEILSTSAHELQ